MTVVITKIWITWNGTKIPVPKMSDDHIKAAYKRCCEILLAVDNNQKWQKRAETGIEHGKDFSLTGSHAEVSTLKPDEALLFKNAFEEEAKKRNIKLPKVTLQNYREFFDTRQTKREYSREKFKKYFNE